MVPASFGKNQLLVVYAVSIHALKSTLRACSAWRENRCSMNILWRTNRAEREEKNGCEFTALAQIAEQ